MRSLHPQIENLRMAEYLFSEIESKWQKIWAEKNAYKTSHQSHKPAYYILDMFPYPSGAGLHVGHPLGYISTDILARYKKLKGFNVLHPMGFDAFGLPAEQYAIQTGQHPAITTKNNIARYKEQLNQIGLGYDWDRSVETCQPNYYKWTQWIFCRLFEHWFDKEAQKAKPISELITRLEKSGNVGLHAACDDDTLTITSTEWNSISEDEKQHFLLKYRLAFLAKTTVNWCPGLGTVLANEEVINGLSERGGYPVVRKEMMQWSLRITAYADRLLSGLDGLDWPEPVKEMQRNWIGASTGASVWFDIENREERIEVFTTRIDTIFGVTFLSLAPEHPLVGSLTTDSQKAEVEAYIEKAKNRSERDRMSDVKTISGAFTGAYAINPFNQEKIEIWIADYVLAGYGTGAVMAVPASDTRDYAFAKHFNLPIILVQEGPQTDISQPDFDAKAGTMINSGELNGLKVPEAIAKAIAWAEENGVGKGKKNYRLRDAIFSRQRYWGEPIPVYYKNGVPHLLPDSALPLELPEVDAYKPTEDGEPPLARAKNWLWEGQYPIEASTMPGWAGSSWYYLRYMDPDNAQEPFSPEAVKYWQQVDLYLGGSEHATGHLLYVRFWTHFLFDLGLLPFNEPAKKLVNQGMIQGVSQKFKVRVYEAGSDNPQSFMEAKLWLASEDLEFPERVGQFIETWHSADVNLVDNQVLKVKDLIDWRADYSHAGFITSMGNGLVNELNPEAALKTKPEVEKMSKSKYNVVNPETVISRYGTDTFRLYEMFLGPIEQSKPWSTSGIEGTFKFLRKFWRLFFNDSGQIDLSLEEPSKAELKVLHKTIKKVGDDIERLNFNTCVSGFMVCVNELQDLKCNKKAVLEPLVVLLSPFAPHLAEELWEKSGKTTSVLEAEWPTYNPDYLIDDVFECPISINGKMRHKVELALNLDQATVENIVLAEPTVQKWMEGKPAKKIIVVPNKIVNIVV